MKGNLIIYNTPSWLTAFTTGRDSGVEALGLRLEDLALPRQVHSDNVLWMQEAGRPEATDAVITDRPGLCVCVKTADCIRSSHPCGLARHSQQNCSEDHRKDAPRQS